jgi:hypothetical protein
MEDQRCLVGDALRAALAADAALEEMV